MGARGGRNTGDRGSTRDRARHEPECDEGLARAASHADGVYAAVVRALYLAPVGLILLAVLWFFRSEDSGGTTSSSGAVVLGDAGLAPDAATPSPLAVEVAPRAEPHVRRRAQSEVAELRTAIEAARAARVREATAELASGSSDTPGTTASPTTVQVPPEEDAERLGRLDPQYIRDAIRDLQPLLRECYELALEDARSSGRETLEGRLVTRFVIGGEPDVGGVIEESSVMDESDLRHPLLEECFTETLFTVELPAPEEGGRVTVHYPFVFRAAEEE